MGLAFYQYEDCQGIDVVQEVRRENRHSNFVESFLFRWLPNKAFSTYRDLCLALADISDEAIAIEKSKWPQLIGIKSADGNNQCWLHHDRIATHSGTISTCWIKNCPQMALLCGDCASDAENDPGVIQRASERRRMDVAARHSQQGGQS
jgi:hypothetical protein